jgi:hypothetical protein
MAMRISECKIVVTEFLDRDGYLADTAAPIWTLFKRPDWDEDDPLDAEWGDMIVVGENLTFDQALELAAEHHLVPIGV